MSLDAGVPPKGPLPPEQAVRMALQIADALEHKNAPPGDPRADIYALGGVLYEMLMGRPVGLDRRPVHPAALEAVLQKCLAQNPADRFQSVAELKAALSGVFNARGFRREYAFVITSVVMLVGGLALLTMEFPRNQRLSNKDVLVVSDFNNTTGDTIFDGTLRTALQIQLEQSPFLKLLDQERVQQDLKLTGRPPNARITPAVAHDICVREAQKATIGGSIADLGKTFAITLQAVNCRSGIMLAREQVQAEGRGQVLTAIAKAAAALRAKLGEPPGSIQTPAVATSSMEALQAYAQGIAQQSQGNVAASVPMFQQAAELDPGFALAFAQLSSAYKTVGDTQRAGDYALKAYAAYVRQDRFDEAAAEARKIDTPAAHRALLRLAFIRPDDAAARTQIAWFAGKPEESLSLGEQSQNALIHGEFLKAARFALQGARLADPQNLQGAAGQLLAQVAGMGEFRGGCRETQKIGAVAALLCSAAPGGNNDPLARATVAMRKSLPAEALEILQTLPASSQVSYLRGVAYILQKKGPEAAAEFQKITDHKGANWGVVYPIAYLGAGRAWALAGDSAKAKHAYEAFLNLWKNADPDLPVLAEAKTEYAGL